MEFSKIIKKTRKSETDALPRPGQPVQRCPAFPQVSQDRQELRRSFEPEVKNVPSLEPLIPEEEQGEWKEPVIKPIKSLFNTQKSQHALEDNANREARDAASLRRGEAVVPAPCPAPSSFPAVEDTAHLYDKLMDTARNIFRPGVVYEEMDTRQIVGLIADVANAVTFGDEKLTELAVTYIMKEESSYLHQHSVNVCILTLVIGFGLDYDRAKMVELGLAAFFHDIGMMRFEDMAKVPRKLTKAEYEEIKQHVEAGDAILKKIQSGLSETIITVQYEIHERLDGSGYPAGKRFIHDYARIIALVDAFESMIHPRPFRPSFSIMEVYKRIFDGKNKYDQKIIKVLADRIGFFPNGSYVELNTREVGRVMKQNPRSPLRPFILVLYGVDGEKLDEAKIKEVNLLKFPTIHVKKCFLEGSAGKGDVRDE